MWVRGLVGAAMIAVGARGSPQGTDAVRGLMMSGHSQYTVLGIVVIALGLVLVVPGVRRASGGAGRAHGVRSRGETEFQGVDRLPEALHPAAGSGGQL